MPESLAVIMQLMSALSTGDATQRLAAAERLMVLGPEASPAAAALVRAVGDASEEVREAAVGALESLETPPVSSIPDLLTRLDDSNSDVAYWAATLLGRLGPQAESAVAALAQVLDTSSQSNVRERAAWALGAIGPAAKSAMPVLNKFADSADARLSRLCREAIAKNTG